MEVVPVLDLLNGVVVRAVGGRRSEYLPLTSRLTDRTDAVGVAQALRESLGLNSLYVADLDAILHGRGRPGIYDQLTAAGFEVQVDAGITTPAAVRDLCDRGVEPVVGLETCPSPAVLQQMVQVAAGRLTFSLDLVRGMPLHRVPAPEWQIDPLAIATQAVQAGARRILILDLADVGEFQGSRSVALCQTLRELHPQAMVTGGGGVRNREDLCLWQNAGAARVLVASALHAGMITRADLA